MKRTERYKRDLKILKARNTRYPQPTIQELGGEFNLTAPAVWKILKRIERAEQERANVTADT